MNIYFIIILAIGLSFDTFAVSVSSGLVMRRITFFNAMKIAFSLALFQAAMPLLGWFLGSEFKTYLVDFDHWIAFILLSILGLKMIYESLTASDEAMRFNPLKFTVLIWLSFATSIDALVVGFSFGLLEIHILLAAFIIGSITFLASMLGILLGKKTGSKFGKQMEIIGGLILISLGTKILFEHLSI